MEQQLRANLLLLLAAGIWGLAFVVQKTSMLYIGAFTFNAIRFALGALTLVPIILIHSRSHVNEPISAKGNGIKRASAAGLLLGLILFGGSSLQQIGLIYTTAGKAAFITGLYIVIVPLLGLIVKQRLNLNMGLGAVFAASGLYLLCMTAGFTIAKGDLLELIGAFFWSIHILLIDQYSRKADMLKLSLFQMVTCSIISFAAALFTETIVWSAVGQVMIPLLYGGILSSGVAFTLQIIGQRNAKPAEAAIILSMETVFAALGGYLFLQEDLGTRGLLGCLLMLVGMILPQLPKLRRAAKL